jgi:hypothetical protein
MRFRILTFQVDPKFTFEISHNLDLLIEQEVSEFLKDFDPGFDLDFSIICNGSVDSKLALGGKMKHRDKRKEISQQLILPNSYLYFEPDNVFYLNSFDFKLKERGYKSYPVERYIGFTLEGIELFFKENSVALPSSFDDLKKDLVDYVFSNKSDFLYESEEKMTLREMIEKKHWAYHEADGDDWLGSDVGIKWLRLAKKYSINNDGLLERRS